MLVLSGLWIEGDGEVKTCTFGKGKGKKMSFMACLLELAVNDFSGWRCYGAFPIHIPHSTF